MGGLRHAPAAVPVDLEEIKRLPIASVSKYLGAEIRNGHNCCPLPNHDDRTPSFHLYEKLNSWHCFGCGRGGSVIDFVMHAQACNFREALIWLRDRYYPNRSNAPSAPTLKSKTNATFHADPADASDAAVYEWVLTNSPLDAEAISYFSGRHISEKTLRAFCVGQINSGAALTHAAIKKFGYDRIEAAGLLAERSTPISPIGVFPSASAIFPFFREGNCEYLQSRRIRACGPSRRWANLRGIRQRPFNAAILDNPNIRDVVLCEGITDALSAAELGRNAIALMGASAHFSDHDAEKLKGKDVYVVADSDGAGQNLVRRLRSQFERLGVVPVFQALSEGCNDINEHLAKMRSKGR